MKYDNANEVLELLNFDKMNNHTLYSIFSLCDVETKKKYLKVLITLRRIRLYGVAVI
jgi:hypothetical protein